MTGKYGSWREEVPEAGWDHGVSTAQAVRLGFIVLMWIGLFWAGAVWLILWTIRSSGFTTFDVTWWKLVIACEVFTIVRAMSARATK